MKTFKATLIVNNKEIDYMDFDASTSEHAMLYAKERFNNAYPISKESGVIHLKEIKLIRSILLTTRAKMHHILDGKHTACGLERTENKGYVSYKMELEEFTSYSVHCKKCVNKIN